MKKNKKIIFLLLLIILFGAIFRFTAVNWDSFGAFHPDERNISWAVTRIHFFDQLNPKFFAYGGLPIYLYRALGELVVWATKNPVWLIDWGHIAVIGRYVSATLSTVSVVLIFLVGSVFFNEVTGLASAAFLAFSPWAIREAHFATTETMLVFFLLLLLITAAKRTSKKYVFLLGVIWGLALSAKTTSLLFGVIPIAAIWLPDIFKRFRQKILFSFFLGSVAALFFFFFSPYTILDLAHFRESMTYESGVALGRFMVPYTLQFLHTPPYIYQIITMLWQSGPVVIFGLIGLVTMIVLLLTTRGRRGELFRDSVTALAKKTFWSDNPADLDGTRTKRSAQSTHELIVFLIFPLLYFGWTGLWYAKFSRYNVPFLPFVTIAAAWLMVWSLSKCRKNHMLFIIILFAYSIIGLATFAWGLANVSVYLRPQTRIAASEWMIQNVSADAHIYTEHWNDGLPVYLPGQSAVVYDRDLLTVYELPDDDKKKAYYAEKLSAGDFIILSTRRIWATMPNLKKKYPVTSVFYEKLLLGQLGYTEVAMFASYPSLLGMTVNDDSAEESIQVFDHPTVRIFQNTGRLPKEEIEKRLIGT